MMAKFNFYFGAAASALLLAILVIGAELIAPFKDWLKITFTHHWVGKAVAITLAFLAIGFLAKNQKSLANLSDEKIAWYSVIASLIAIFLFFAIEFFK